MLIGKRNSHSVFRAGNGVEQDLRSGTLRNEDWEDLYLEMLINGMDLRCSLTGIQAQRFAAKVEEITLVYGTRTLECGERTIYFVGRSTGECIWFVSVRVSRCGNTNRRESH